MNDGEAGTAVGTSAKEFKTLRKHFSGVPDRCWMSFAVEGKGQSKVSVRDIEACGTRRYLILAEHQTREGSAGKNGHLGFSFFIYLSRFDVTVFNYLISVRVCLKFNPVTSSGMLEVTAKE